MKHFLVIGINYEGSDAQLSGCLNDITDVKKYLTARGFVSGVELVEGGENPPVRAGIIAGMNDFVKIPASYKYVHYSGHGSQLLDNNGDERDLKDECICPLDIDWNAPDNNFIRDDEMNKILVQNLPAGCKMCVVFDSCHSGSALDLPYRWTETGHIYFENASKTAGDVVFISGCKDSQTSADATFAGRANGALTKALLAVLASGEKMTWRQLAERVRVWLRTRGYDQIPQLDASKKELFDELVDL